MTEEIPGIGETRPRGGLQVEAAIFSRVQQLIHSVRLTQDERIVAETGSVASEVHIARKEFEMGHIDQAFRAVTRFSTAFDQKVAQWENLARKKERNKQQLSMQQVRKMNAEHAGVRTRIQLIQAQLRRLRSGLDQLDNLAQSHAAASEQPAVPEPSAKTVELRVPEADN